MVVPNREFANINLLFNLSAMSNSVEANTFSEDVNMGRAKGQCWKEQSAQQLGAVWTTGNHLPVVYTSYGELKVSNDV